MVNKYQTVTDFPSHSPHWIMELATTVLKYRSIDVHALESARKNKNGEHTLLGEQFKTVKHY